MPKVFKAVSLVNGSLSFKACYKADIMSLDILKFYLFLV